MSSLGREVFQLGYEISPIILVNGIASQIPGQMLPIVALTESASFTAGLLNGTAVPALDQFFAHWKPLAGTTLIHNVYGQFPFANQQTAADCVIAHPLTIAMLMVCPVQSVGGYTAKLASLTVLQAALKAHTNMGGTFSIATPGQIFSNCLLTSVRDVSGGESKQVQHAWQFDFIQPLITLDLAAQVMNSLMNKIAGGLNTGQAPSVSGIPSTTGQASGAIAYAVPTDGSLGINGLAGTALTAQ
ncbi:hypothetical protein [Caballeronia sp. LjRoot31]|uniref:hypothetical protein n=1 Tax=Caballeronia sp. LjRoot31 TaxID=3342324 RepID=UPI003ECE4774